MVHYLVNYKIAVSLKKAIEFPDLSSIPVPASLTKAVMKVYLQLPMTVLLTHFQVLWCNWKSSA